MLFRSQQGQSLEAIFSRYGLQDIRAAVGQKDKIQIPRLKDWLRIDFNKKHPYNVQEDGTPMTGCPRLFFFDGRCGEMVSEIEGLRKADPTKVQGDTLIEKKDPHHGIDTCKWWASDDPCFMGDEANRQEDDYDDGQNEGCPYTNY